MTVSPVVRGAAPADADADSVWWWDALAEGRLMLPRCLDCAACFFPPMPGCPRCGGSSMERIPASGRGSVYSWVVIHQALDPEFVDDVPVAIVAVDLEEGARVVGRAEPGTVLAAGAPVVAAPYEGGGTILLGFRAAAAE